MTTDKALKWSHVRLTWRTGLLALLIVLPAVVVLGFAQRPERASAANISVEQCNDIGPGVGATTGMTCRVTVENRIVSGVTSSTVTVERLCSLAPCPPGDGIFTTDSSDLVTVINQCNNSDNDTAQEITCEIRVTNIISADTPDADPLTAATVNQCVGSGEGGGGTVNCDPYPATTTGATIIQCNGSANGGGATAACLVGSDSMVSPALPIQVIQCNGTGNAGGSVVTCTSTITTVIAAVPASTTTTTVPVTTTTTAATTTTTALTTTTTALTTTTTTTTTPTTTTPTTTVTTTTTTPVTTTTVPTTSATTRSAPPVPSTATVTPSGTTRSAPPLPSTTTTAIPVGPSPSASPGPGPTSATSGPQVPRVPIGGVQAGYGSTVAPGQHGLLALGVGLLLAGAISGRLSRWAARRRS